MRLLDIKNYQDRRLFSQAKLKLRLTIPPETWIILDNKTEFNDMESVLNGTKLSSVRTTHLKTQPGLLATNATLGPLAGNQTRDAANPVQCSGN